MAESPSMVDLIKEHAQLARDLRRLQIVFDAEKCMGLWTCYEVCPVDCWAPDYQTGVVDLVRPELCVACNACVLQCTEGAIELRVPGA